MIPLKMQAMFTAFPVFSETCPCGITKSISGAPVNFEKGAYNKTHAINIAMRKHLINYHLKEKRLD